ncbi:MAG: hypothetical protein H0V71_12510 [Chloroflexi bacterium]|nr:hypothetical protein [Chloroflexota bacterium]
MYNAIAHALAVVGLNTTVFVEAAILDSPCVSIRFKSGDAPAITSSFVHFTYLLDGGFLHVVEDERTAAAVIRRIAAEGDPLAGERRAFVRRFVRPCGLERAAADVAAESLIATARGRN